MQPQPQILVVDDDHEIRTLLGRYLDGQGFRVSVAADRRECEQQLITGQFDLIVLDVMLPDGSGLDICRALRDSKPHVPVILLTALKEDVDRIVGLELGADDYLAKPFNPRELLARIRAVLRRADIREPIAANEQEKNPVLAFAGWTLDLATRQLTNAQGEPVKNKELWLELLEAAKPHQVTWQWVKGHAGHHYNERCDVLAKAEALQHQKG